MVTGFSYMHDQAYLLVLYFFILMDLNIFEWQECIMILDIATVSFKSFAWCVKIEYKILQTYKLHNFSIRTKQFLLTTHTSHHFIFETNNLSKFELQMVEIQTVRQPKPNYLINKLLSLLF